MVGKTIEEITFYEGYEPLFKSKPEDIKSILEGRLIKSISRIGKYIIMECFRPKTGPEDPSTVSLLIHLAMTGGFLKGANKHTRAVFRMTDETILSYTDIRKFGSIRIFSPKGLDVFIDSKKLGIDVFSSFAIPIEYQLMTKGSTERNITRPVKSILMDQTILSGLGNIYATEALFHCGINPEDPLRIIEVDKFRDLAIAIKDILKLSYENGGSSIRDYRNVEGQKGNFQTMIMIYGKKICPVCETRIVKVLIDKRSSSYCPTCQPRKVDQ